MNCSIAQGRWQQLKGALAAQWGQITGDGLGVIAARHRQRVGELHASTSAAQDEIAREIERIRRRSVHFVRGA